MHKTPTKLKATKIEDSNSGSKISKTERKGTNGAGIMSVGQEFAVSALAAGLAHVIHHPLYTLKSQMMYYGPDFKIRRFFQQAWQQKHNFLYRGQFVP